MITRAVDSDNDWQFGKGKNDYKRDRKAVAQNIKTRLQSFAGDCFFAKSDGVDWFNLLGTTQRTKLSLSIAATILNTENVLRILEVSNSLSNNRNMLIQYKVLTTFGEVTDTFQFTFNI